MTFFFRNAEYEHVWNIYDWCWHLWFPWRHYRTAVSKMAAAWGFLSFLQKPQWPGKKGNIFYAHIIWILKSQGTFGISKKIEKLFRMKMKCLLMTYIEFYIIKHLSTNNIEYHKLQIITLSITAPGPGRVQWCHEELDQNGPQCQILSAALPLHSVPQV